MGLASQHLPIHHFASQARQPPTSAELPLVMAAIANVQPSDPRSIMTDGLPGISAAGLLSAPDNYRRNGEELMNYLPNRPWVMAPQFDQTIKHTEHKAERLFLWPKRGDRDLRRTTMVVISLGLLKFTTIPFTAARTAFEHLGTFGNIRESFQEPSPERFLEDFASLNGLFR